MTIRASAKRRHGFVHDIDVDGHALVADEPEDAGGTDVGPSPTRMLTAALASCTAITIEMYAKRKGWDLAELSVDVENEGQAFEVTIHLPDGLSSDQISRIIKIAGKCPVHKLIAGATEINIADPSEAG